MKAHRLCVSLNSRLESNKEEEDDDQGGARGWGRDDSRFRQRSGFRGLDHPIRVQRLGQPTQGTHPDVSQTPTDVLVLCFGEFGSCVLVESEFGTSEFGSCGLVDVGSDFRGYGLGSTQVTRGDKCGMTVASASNQGAGV